MAINHSDLNKLWKLADLEASRSGSEFESVFHSIGLGLVIPIGSMDYDSTPVNVSAFARTGGDGVNYGLLEFDGSVTDASPVAMTVPMMFDAPNLIVGENLRALLCLGINVGYVWLEQLVYDRTKTIQQLAHPEQDAELLPSEGEEKLLQLLRYEFNLKPWADIDRHLTEINQAYLPMLKALKKRL